MLSLHIIPSRLQKFIIIHIPQLHPPTLPLYTSKNPIFMISIYPIKGTVLGRARDAAGGDLLDIDMGKAVFNVFGDCEGDGCEGDGFAQEPAYALLWGRISSSWEVN